MTQENAQQIIRMQSDLLIKMGEVIRMQNETIMLGANHDIKKIDQIISECEQGLELLNSNF